MTAAQVIAWERLARVRQRRDEASELEARARSVRADANASMIYAAGKARDAGLTGEQIAEALGITRARLYQLVAKSSHGSDSK